MKKLQAFWNGLLKALPHFWGVLWISIITVASTAVLAVTIKWLLQVLEVI